MGEHPQKGQVCACVFGCRGHNTASHRVDTLQQVFPLSDPGFSSGPSGYKVAISRPFHVQASSILVSCVWSPSLSPGHNPHKNKFLSGLSLWGKDWTTGSCCSNCHRDILFISEQHLQVQLLTNFCPCRLRIASQQFSSPLFSLPYLKPEMKI